MPGPAESAAAAAAIPFQIVRHGPAGSAAALGATFADVTDPAPLR